MKKRPRFSLHEIIHALLVEENSDPSILGELEEATESYYSRRDALPQYGEYLVRQGVISRDRLLMALARQALARKRYADAFLHLAHAADSAYRGIRTQLQILCDALLGGKDDCRK